MFSTNSTFRLLLNTISLLILATAVTQLAAELPPVPYPASNPASEEKRMLGKILFWEEQLSSNNKVACGT